MQTPALPHHRRTLTVFASLVLAMGLAACGGGGSGTSGDAATGMSAAAQLGEKIFHDPSLSASGSMACASCHDQAFGHASPLATPVVFGGPLSDQPGLRAAPALGYLRYNLPFSIASDGTPSGGFFWDGRAASLAEQAKGPFLAPNEMANASVADVIAKLSRTPYVAAFKAQFGADILNDPAQAYERMAFAIERYQREDPDFAPFDSKFDAMTAGRASFTPQEIRGLAWFNRPDKGNCAACHPSTKPANAPGALFTDFSYDALGVPRNQDIAANADASFFDQGLCARADLSSRADLCGAFKVPSLRNVAKRRHFFHNGRFDSLEEVVRFYVTRDTDAARWYPLDALGQPVAYNDLPQAARANVNVTEVPYNRRAGQAASLDGSEIADLVAFLRTLSDGYTP